MDPTQAFSAPRARGAALVGAVVLAVAVAGLSFGLLTESEASRRTVVRSEASFRALELAEIGLCRIESPLVEGLLRELQRKADPSYSVPTLWETVDDGTNPPYLRLVLGPTAYGNGTYDVLATCPVADPNDIRYARRWTVRSHGQIDHAGLAAERWIEAGYWLRSGGAFVDGLLSLEAMTINGTVTTDSYDSDLGTYASQVDPVTGLADFGGSVGSNTGDITGIGTILVDGDATPGPGDSVDLTGGATVVGETEPRLEEKDFPLTPLADFQYAYDNNEDAEIVAGAGVNVNVARVTPRNPYVDYSFTGNGTVTFPGGTYFFNNFSASAGTVLQFTGPSKIYVTEEFDAGGATFVNATPGQVPSNVQIYAHPYPVPAAPRLPGNSTEWTPTVKLAGGPDAAAVFYGPEAQFTITGTSEFFGAAVARWIDMSGTSEYHYDRALDYLFMYDAPRLERRYWREVSKSGGAMDVRR